MSGGQQQRVALARALVTEPRLLLLDEPLAALDVSTKNNLRRHLRTVLRESQAANVLVTHDLLDAVALADRMVVIETGGIVQSGTPAEVTARPRSQYVADLVGMNLLRGSASGTSVALDGGGLLVISAAATGSVLAVVPPSAVSVYRSKPATTAANVWTGQVAGVDLMGDRVRVRIDGQPSLSAEVPPGAVDELKLDHAGELWACVDPSAVTVYPP
jgi:molybdate transport system ATP-binding protein